MLSDEVIEKVTERLVRRMEQANTYIIKQIGRSIKKIGTLSPTKAHELVQILKYGGDYDKIIRKLKEITKINIKDIKKIFYEVAKENYEFAEQFYRYRNKKFIPYDENKLLQRQVDAITKQTTSEFINLTNTRALGFGWVNDNGTITYKGLKDTYYDLLDKAVLNVEAGKETFDSALYRQLKEIGGGGIRVIFKNRSMRADSAIRMQMMDALRTLHNEMDQQFGKEFDADGVEISVHLTPAPDHEWVQGRQFTINQYDKDGNLIKKGEFEKFQNDEDAVSYDGIEFPKISEETGQDRRSISQYNCYHYIFSIILGVSKPRYTNKELKKMIDNAHKKIKFDNKEYTMYEATQLQRKLETAIREAKDEQIMGKTSGNEKLILKSQKRINQLTNKYKELSKISGLPTMIDRLRVSGYKRVAMPR